MAWSNGQRDANWPGGTQGNSGGAGRDRAADVSGIDEDDIRTEEFAGY
jgi:hypothetical protein